MPLAQKVLAFVIGAAFGLASAFVLSPGLAAFVPKSGGSGGLTFAFWAVIVGSGLLAAFAPTMRRAFGRSLLVLGACFWALPLSAFLLSSRAASEVMSASSAESAVFAAVGAGAAGALVTGVATFFGLILGSIAVVAGLVLVLGGRREVIVERFGQEALSQVAFKTPRREPPVVRPKDSPQPPGPRLGGVRR